jgi:two-component system NtrC family response regulator
LAQQFFQRVAIDLGRLHLTLSDQVIKTLTEYSWPGNIRELKNVIERAVLLASGETIQSKDLHLEFEEGIPAHGNDCHLTLKEIQRLHIQRALTAEHGNVVRAAVRLGMTRSTLYNKIRTLKVDHYHPKDKEGDAPETGAAASTSG